MKNFIQRLIFHFSKHTNKQSFKKPSNPQSPNNQPKTHSSSQGLKKPISLKQISQSKLQSPQSKQTLDEPYQQPANPERPKQSGSKYTPTQVLRSAQSSTNLLLHHKIQKMSEFQISQEEIDSEQFEDSSEMMKDLSDKEKRELFLKRWDLIKIENLHRRNK